MQVGAEAGQTHPVRRSTPRHQSERAGARKVGLATAHAAQRDGLSLACPVRSPELASPAALVRWRWSAARWWPRSQPPWWTALHDAQHPWCRRAKVCMHWLFDPMGVIGSPWLHSRMACTWTDFLRLGGRCARRLILLSRAVYAAHAVACNDARTNAGVQRTRTSRLHTRLARTHALATHAHANAHACLCICL